MNPCQGKRLLGLLLLSLGAVGCEGKILGSAPSLSTRPPGSRASLVCGATPSPGAAPLRRLTNEEWKYTVGDLLGTPDLAATLSAGFTPETYSLGFRDSAEFLNVQDVLAGQYMDAADQVSAAAVQNLSSLVPCNPATTGADACAASFISQFGARAFRRPLTQAEVANYQAVFDKALAPYGFSTGIQWIVYTMLQSPHFLYRPEALNATGAAVAVAPYELATRLSYLFWHSLPDAELFDAASSGKLATVADVQRETTRMLADPKARRFISFYDQWLEVDQLPAMTRDATLYPTFDANLKGLFQQETDTFMQYLLWDGGDQTFATMMTAPFSLMNDQLATHYGIAAVTGSAFKPVNYTSARRAGILAQAGVLTEHDKPTRSSIVRRGLKIRTQFLCQTIGSPPAGVNLTLGSTDPTQTQAQMLAAHRTDATCASCHNMMDPVGTAFEELDALGRSRTKDEQGRALSAVTRVDYTKDMNGPIDGEADLAGKLANSDQVHSCVATQFFRFAYGRGETPADACSLAVLEDTFQQSGFNVMQLTEKLTQTDAFLYQPVAQ